MIRKIMALIGVISGMVIGFVLSNNFTKFPRFSNIIDTKTMKMKKVNRIVETEEKCIGDCRDSITSSSRGSSSRGSSSFGGK